MEFKKNMTNIFNCKKKLSLLICIYFTTSVNAMYYPVEKVPFTPAPSGEFYQTVMANQELSQQNAILAQQLLLERQRATIAKLTPLVDEAKKLRGADGKFNDPARQLLRKAADGHHPEALFLLNNNAADSKACQEWRLQEALDQSDLLLQSCPEGSPHTTVQFDCYHRFLEIIHNPDLQDDREIRATALNRLGYLCFCKLGVPQDKANELTAAHYFRKAAKLGNRDAAQSLENLKNYESFKLASQKQAELKDTLTAQGRPKLDVKITTKHSQPTTKVEPHPLKPEIAIEQADSLTAVKQSHIAVKAIRGDALLREIEQTTQTNSIQPLIAQQSSDDDEVAKIKKLICKIDEIKEADALKEKKTTNRQTNDPIDNSSYNPS